jgi:hypothetical protein
LINSLPYVGPAPPPPACPTPTISPAGGTFHDDETVTITDSDTHATIYYTINGVTPNSSSARYTAAFKVSATETVEAIAAAPGDSPSTVASAKFTIELPTATPVISVPAGTYTTVKTVKITDPTPNAVIYYTINGKAPSLSSKKYTGPITVSASETIKAFALAPGYVASALASETYTIHLPPAATPAFSVKAGPYSKAQTVKITDATQGAIIYYATHGKTPTTASTKYTGPITVSATETIKAIAVAAGHNDSAVASATYTIN